MFLKRSLLLLAAATTLCAQQTSISGVVTDQTGAAIPEARVSATPQAGGTSATTMTNRQGVYNIPALSAADYVVRFEVAGFAPAERSVSLLVGQVLSVDLVLKPVSVTTSVDVTAEGATVSTASSTVGGNIDSRQLHDVPLNGRNWMMLALMVPGITKNDVDSNSPVGGADGGKFQINVDGQQVTQNNSGSSNGQPRYSQDAIAEFQIITNRFDATQGRSLRAQINAQTKSGSNMFHGTAFGYFRSDTFNASDPVAHVVLPYSDQQYGGSAGGPIFKDKLWFFAAYEGERQPATIFTTPTGFGGITYTLPTQSTTRTILGRLDFQKSQSDRLSLRFNGYTFSNPFSGVGGTAHPSTATAVDNYASSILLSWSKIISPQLVNEAKLGFNYFMYKNAALSESQEYRLGSVTVGAPYNYPKEIAMEVFSGRDDLFWSHSNHSVKTGGEYLFEVHHGFFPQYSRGAVTAFSSTPPNLASLFPVWNDPSTWNLAVLSQYAGTFIKGFGSYNYNLQRNTIGFWMQDDWKVLPRLTLNLGVRYDNDIGMLSSSLNLTSGLATPHGGDNNNIAPRLGFAWDVMGDHKSVIRGGAGLYYGDVEANQYYDQALFNGQTTIQASIDAKPGAPISLSQPFGTTTASDFLNHTVTAPLQALQLVQPGVVTPYTVQMSLGGERQLSPNWTISADYVHWRLFHEWQRIDQNLTYDPTTGYNINPNTAGGRPDPRYTTILRFVTPASAGALYNGFQMEIKRRFANKLMLTGGYTLSHVRDSSGGAFSLPNNQFNLPGEWGNGGDDQRHTLNVSGSYQLKWGFQFSSSYHFGSGAVQAVSAGSSPFVNGGSNRTFLATTKVYDDPSWNYVNPVNAKYDIVNRNPWYGRPIHRLDARITRTFVVKERVKLIGIAEAFNLLNHSNYGSYATSITTASFSSTAQNLNLEYQPRMLQLAGRFEF